MRLGTLHVGVDCNGDLYEWDELEDEPMMDQSENPLCQSCIYRNNHDGCRNCEGRVYVGGLFDLMMEA